MKEIGIFRRIDELGRIVIPKEMRKRLRVKTGDYLDIAIEDEKIILKKYHELNSIKDMVIPLFDSIKKEFNLDLVLTSSSVVSYSTLSDISLNDEVLESFIRILTKDLIYEASKNNINITSSYTLDRYMIAKKLYVEGDFKGIVIILSEHLMIKNHKEILSMILNYLTYHFKNN